ncbi:hypothetical protein ACFQH6_02020 [Halobacteriaceae archaeon GCM10025711]
MNTALPRTADAMLAATQTTSGGSGGDISWGLILMFVIIAVAVIAVAWLFSSSGGSSD